MPKYWGKQIFAHGRLPEVGQKQKKEKKKEKKDRTSLWAPVSNSNFYFDLDNKSCGKSFEYIV